MSQVYFQNLLLNKFTTGISKKSIPPPQKILKNWKYLRGRWVTRNKHFSDYHLNLIYPTKSWTACVADLPSAHWHWATKKSKQGGRGRRIRKGISSTGVFENSCGISMCLGFWPCWNSRDVTQFCRISRVETGRYIACFLQNWGAACNLICSQKKIIWCLGEKEG